MAVVISTLNNPWFVVLGTGGRTGPGAGYRGHHLRFPRTHSPEAEHFDNIIAMGYDAIPFNPNDADGSVLNAAGQGGGHPHLLH
ncbi:MAG: hypothetical protein R2751_19575 [Bacteroidales bacterium]